MTAIGIFLTVKPVMKVSQLESLGGIQNTAMTVQGGLLESDL
jgi:hypothetical protein